MVEINKLLNNVTALVTGGSRGVGRGIALGLGEYGATIYITGRNAEELKETAVLVEKSGGVCIPLRCDHNNDSETKAVFENIKKKPILYHCWSIAPGEDMNKWLKTEVLPGVISFGNNPYRDGIKCLR